MIKKILATFSAVAALALAPAAYATRVVDTGTPSGSGFALSFDSVDWYAAKVSFAQASSIDAIMGHILGGSAGETFDISLFANGPTPTPGSLLYTGTATYAADGWNGLSGLSGWRVEAGSYWIEFEIQGLDTLNSSANDLTLMDTGAPHPLATTAFNSGSGAANDYVVLPMSFGLEVDATAAVPWPSSASLMTAGLALLSTLALARRRR